MTATDIRYGRRGGGWTPGAARPTPRGWKDQLAACTQCGSHFGHRQPEPPAICGAPLCRALADWDPQEWAARARMARIRRDCGLDLNDFDRAALDRTTGERAA